MKQGGDGKSRWKVERLLRQNGFWKEQVSCQNFLTNSSDHRWVVTITWKRAGPTNSGYGPKQVGPV